MYSCTMIYSYNTRGWRERVLSEVVEENAAERVLNASGAVASTFRERPV